MHDALLLYLSVALLIGVISSQTFALTDPEIDTMITEMTIEEKVGQLIMVGFEGTQPNETIETHIRERFVGGVVLFSRNIQSPQQTAELTNELQRLASATARQIPLFIGIDQEGGWVIRLKEGATVLPGNMALGATDSTELAERAGEVTAVELAAVGVNLNFAPVMDVNNNPQNPVIDRRSFGESAELVSRLGVAYIHGLQDNGILGTAKHFPGHGDTTVDSHFDLPTVNHDRERIHALELHPFRAAIDADVAAIMTAHIVYPAFDADRPATLSPTILTDLLRKELGFDGLIITDDMEMKAIDDRYRSGEAAVMTVEAGADIVMVLWSPTKQIEVFDALLSAVKSGRISQARLDQSVKRILKNKAAAFNQRFVDLDAVGGTVGTDAHQQLAQTIASQAITVVKNRDNLLPLKLKPETSVLILSKSLSLFESFKAHHPNTVEARIPEKSEVEGILPQLILQAENADAVIAGIINDEQAALVQRISLETKTPIIVIALGSPYTLRDCPAVSVSLAAYDTHDASVSAAVDVIVGAQAAQGKLPVRLSIED
ncbi:beta-N-acetylhexosaminidase [Candidatus Poribacteria bacterium]|nr:MAG: beta-N-acetylhexosaminidase [Candidatus Poribacteria bacterium]